IPTIRGPGEQVPWGLDSALCARLTSQQSLVIPCTVCSLWSSPALFAVSGHPLLCLQSLVIPCSVCSLWSSPALSAVSGHSLHCVRSLWSSPA
ncbi:unnamed protein product, partial [Staurois parvus]